MIRSPNEKVYIGSTAIVVRTSHCGEEVPQSCAWKGKVKLKDLSQRLRSPPSIKCIRHNLFPPPCRQIPRNSTGATATAAVHGMTQKCIEEASRRAHTIIQIYVSAGLFRQPPTKTDIFSQTISYKIEHFPVTHAQQLALTSLQKSAKITSTSKTHTALRHYRNIAPN